MPRPLTLGEEDSGINERDAGWAPQTLSIFWRREVSFDPAANRTAIPQMPSE